MRKIILGSRGSELALAQTNYVAEELCRAAPGLEVAVHIVKSRGDKIQDVPLSQVGGKGIFTKELEVALLDGTIDLAVHSLKDLPTELPRGLRLAAIPRRENPADVMVFRACDSLDELPQGSRVGTSSIRRMVQLRAYRPDLVFLDIRGNVPTRLAKLDAGDYDAIILAAAGMHRLGIQRPQVQELHPPIMLPAVGQGALGIEIREEDEELAMLLTQIHDATAAAEAACERALLAGLGGGCQTPLGARATVSGDTISLQAVISAIEDSTQYSTAMQGEVAEAAELGRSAAKALLAQGGDALLESGQEQIESHALEGLRLAVTRAKGQNEGMIQALKQAGAEPLEFPTIEIVAVTPDRLPEASDDIAWLVFTSANAVTQFQAALHAAGRGIVEFRNASVCAVGPATAAAVHEAGLPLSITPQDYHAEGVLEAMAAVAGGLEGKRVLLPRGKRARPFLPEGLREKGAVVEECVVYDTRNTPVPQKFVETLLNASPHAVLFTSASTVESFCAAVPPSDRHRLQEHAVYASIGPSTTAACRTHGLPVAFEAEQHDMRGMLQGLVAYFSGEVLS